MNNNNYQPRTINEPYIDQYRGQAIMHVPYGKDGRDFAFGMEKAKAVDEMIRNGTWRQMMLRMEINQRTIVQMSARKEMDIIQL